MARSLQYIDFDMEDLTREYFLIATYSKGGFSFETIKEMVFKDYEIVLKEAVRIQKLDINDSGETTIKDDVDG